MRQLVAGPDHEPHAFAECNGSKLWRVFDSRSNEPSECLPNEQRNCAVATDWLLKDATYFFLPNFLGNAFTKNLGGYFQPMECCIECFPSFNLTTLCIKLWDQ